MRLTTLRAAPEAIRVEDFMGVPHTVVPIVALVEGVIQCANCPVPELALASEFASVVEAWNGRPVTLRHPQIAGIPVPAGMPEILETFQIGTIFNSSVEDGQLRMEAWIHPQLVEALGEEAMSTLARIAAGEPVEVSTGFFADTIQAEGEFDGKQYEAVQRNIRPDHLAILGEEQIGACSWHDGCGAPRVNTDVTWASDTANGTTSHVIKVEKHDCKCGTLQTDVGPVKLVPANQKEKNMDRDETITGLINHQATQFEESDREWLDSLEDEQLARLEPQELEAPEAEISVEALEAFAAEQGLELVTKESKPTTREEWLAAAPEDVQEDLRELARSREAKRNGLVKKIKGYEKNVFSDAQLSVKSSEELEQLVSFIGAQDEEPTFEGRPAPSALESDHVAPPAPSRWGSN